MSDDGASRGGPGLATLLTVLFVGLKLTGHIAWSWWWVLSPITISFGALLTILLFAVVAAVVSK